jgi:dolichol-phosphate mannosyltransferase
VVAGLRMAEASWVCIMDADLQHPPELVPQMLAKAERSTSDLVVASRYGAHGAASGLNRGRSLISRSSTAAAQILFPQRLRHVTDPMSGFFLVRKEALAIEQLQPRGFKILLEIMVRTPGLRITEVGFEFGTRYAGESKASLREGMRYLSHLCQLRFGEDTLQFVRFLIVGSTGLLVNSVVLWLTTELLSLHYLVSAVVATEGSTLWNFALTELWVFSGRCARSTIGRWPTQTYAISTMRSDAELSSRRCMGCRPRCCAAARWIGRTGFRRWFMGRSRARSGRPTSAL